MISTNKEQGTTVTEYRKPAREHRSKVSVEKVAQPKTTRQHTCRAGLPVVEEAPFRQAEKHPR